MKKSILFRVLKTIQNCNSFLAALLGLGTHLLKNEYQQNYG